MLIYRNKGIQISKLSLKAFLLIPVVATASEYYEQPFFRQSIVQEADNTFYIALGGGGAYQQVSDWKVDPGASYTTINDVNRNYAGAGVGLAAIGYGFQSFPVRMEVAYNYIGQSKYDWDNLIPFSDAGAGIETPAHIRINSNTVMFNLYADFWVNEQLAPYITGGVGYSINSAKLQLTRYDTNTGVSTKFPESTVNKGNFAWNAGIGLKYAIAEDWTAAIQVNYVALGKVEVKEEDPTTGADVDFLHADDLFSVTGTVNIAYHF